jgi:uncharacterized membrane protein (GlpM family)
MIFFRTIVTFLLFSNFLVSQELIIESERAQPETILFRLITLTCFLYVIYLFIQKIL